MPYAPRPWASGLGDRYNLRHSLKRGLLKEVTRLSYLDDLLMDVSNPAADVYFILTSDLSPPRGRWWMTVPLILWSSTASTEGNLTTYFSLGVNCEKWIPAWNFYSRGIRQLLGISTCITLRAHYTCSEFTGISFSSARLYNLMACYTAPHDWSSVCDAFIIISNILSAWLYL